MHIKSMVIDGFKSYAQRTEINGFDPLFNAITGLNGSGKSNILDSICFLLGITNLSHVSKYYFLPWVMFTWLLESVCFPFSTVSVFPGAAIGLRLRRFLYQIPCTQIAMYTYIADFSIILETLY